MVANVIHLIALIVIVTIAAAIHIADLATSNLHIGFVHAAADIAAAEERSAAMIACLHEDQSVVVHVVHAATAINGTAHHAAKRDRCSAANGSIGITKDHPTAHIGKAFHRMSAHHGTRVAAAIDGVHTAAQHNQVGQDGQVTHVVAAKDDAHMGIGVFTRMLDIDKNGGATRHGDAITTAIHRIDTSAYVFAAFSIDVDVHKGIGLHGLVVGVTVILRCVVVSAVTATIDGVDLGFALDADIGMHAHGCQVDARIGSHVIIRRQDTVGDLCHQAALVVATIECAMNGTTRNEHFVAAIDGGHIAAAIHVAVHRAAAHAHRGVSHEVTESVVLVGLSNKTNWSHIAASIHIALNLGVIASQHHMGLVVGGDGQADVVAQIDDAINEIDTVVTMVIAITASIEVLINRAARHFHIGGTFHILVFITGHRTRIGYYPFAAHVTADVAAAEDITHMAVLNFHPGAVFDVTHLAATIKVVHEHIGTVHQHMGTEIYGLSFTTYIKAIEVVSKNAFT